MEYLINGENNNPISPHDRGIHYGDGIFETMLCKNGRILFLQDHLNRLERGCEFLHINFPGREILLNEINSLTDKNSNCIIKIIISRGPGGRGYKIPELQTPTRIVFSYPLPGNLSDIQKNGVSLEFCRRKLSCPEGFSDIKHTNRLEYILARNEITDPDIYDGILCDTSGNIIETTSSNIFWLKNNIIFTPDLSECGLKGIMRNFLLNKPADNGANAGRNKIEIRTGNFSPDMIADADEVFITNSVIGVVPVIRIDGIEFKPGMTTKLFQKGMKKI